MRKWTFLVAISMLGALGGCGKPGDAVPESVETPFNLAQCLNGLEVTAGDGVKMPPGACMSSPNKAFALVMQPSGALEVLPVAPNGTPGKPVWTTGSRIPSPGDASTVFQSDGNLVVYNRRTNAPIWNAASTAPLGDYQLDLTDQGELVIRHAKGEAIWSSKSGLAAPSPATKAPGG
jgi:hypothetical protein